MARYEALATVFVNGRRYHAGQVFTSDITDPKKIGKAWKPLDTPKASLPATVTPAAAQVMPKRRGRPPKVRVEVLPPPAPEAVAPPVSDGQ